MHRPLSCLAASLVWGVFAVSALAGTGPVVHPFLWNATTNDPDVDEPPGLGTGYVVSSSLGTDTVEDAFGNQDGGGLEPDTFIFDDYGVPDNGNGVLGDGGETVDYIEWETVSPVEVLGYRAELGDYASFGRNTELVSFLVDGNEVDFFDNDSQIVPNIILRFFEDGAVTGSTFRIELTRQTEDGPRVWEIDALTASICGNEVVEGLEQCDDGNLLPGDGCDAMCRVEQEFDRPFGSAAVLYDCEGVTDGAFSQGEASASSGIQYAFPDGPGGNVAEASLGYSVVYSATVTLDNQALIALPGSAAADDCLVGGSVSLTHPLTFTSTTGGLITDTVTVAFQAILDGWQAHVPPAAPAASDTRFGFDVSLGEARITETLTLDPAGLQIAAWPGAWVVDPLPGGGVSVGGTVTITQTLPISSPAVVELFADQFAFVPATAQGISVTNVLPGAFRYQVVSLTPGIEVRSLGVPGECGDGVVQPPEECDDGNTLVGDECDADCMIPIPEPSAPHLTLLGALVLLLARRSIAGSVQIA